ncbi:MAG TPA: hypothetical protein PK397_04035 [Ignavibacteriaceae bacterium]|nr:hypothetical protein [Ignavibacteriaceae bacterium]
MRILISIFTLLFFIMVPPFSMALEQDSIEVYLIDSFVPPENPDVFIVSFYTSDTCLSAILIDGKYEVKISEIFSDNHRAEIDISKYAFRNDKVEFLLITEDAEKNKYKSEKYEFTIPIKKVVQAGGSNLMSCLFGSIVFLTPSPTLVLTKDEKFFSLSKDLPVFAFYSGGFNYPKGYLFVGYSHTFNFAYRNLARLGFKYIFEVPYIEFVSPGISGFSNMKGFNGVSSEVTLGLFKVYSVFTVTAGSRFNIKPGTAGSEFWEFNVGLFSSFFTLHF